MDVKQINLYAYTEREHNYPAFVSINRWSHDDSHSVSVRSRGEHGQSVIVMEPYMLVAMAKAILEHFERTSS